MGGGFSTSMKVAVFGRGCLRGGGRVGETGSVSESDLGGERLGARGTVDAECLVDFLGFLAGLDLADAVVRVTR